MSETTYRGPYTVLYQSDVPTVAPDYQSLLHTLTGEEHDLDSVMGNLARATRNPYTAVYPTWKAESDRVVASLVSNSYDDLAKEAGQGILWIDDVVTNPEDQGNGLSRAGMDLAEVDGGIYSRAVLLTSNPTREVARAGYERRGYSLEGGVWRKTFDDIRPAGELATMLTVENLDEDLVAAVDEVLPDRENLEGRLEDLAEADFSKLFIQRENGRVTSVIGAYLCPITVGYKPWLHAIYDAQTEAGLQAQVDAEAWARAHNKSVNFIVAEGLSAGLSNTDGYQQRDTGLYVKRFERNNLAL